MNIKEISSKKLFKEYEMHLPYEELDNSINAKIMEIIPTVSIAGFRKGKAPLNIVKKKYESNVLSEVIEKLVQEKTKKLVEEKKLIPYRQPKIEIKKYEKNLPIEITIKIDLKPEIKIFPFEKLEIIKHSIQIDEKTLDENYKNFIDSQKQFKKVENNRAIKKSDRVFVNILTSDSSVPDFLHSQENLPIDTNSDYQILPGISDKLITKKIKIGDKIKLKFDLSKVMKLKEKKEVEFEIEILSLEENIDFKINKEFLDKNNLKNEEELKENIKKNVISQYDEQLLQIERKNLMDILDVNYSFDVPQGIYDEEFNSIWHRLEHAKKEGKLDEDDKDLNDEQLANRYKIIAMRRVKLAILMQEIAKNQNIEISQKELTDGMMKYASQYPGQEKQIFEYFQKNPSSIESIRGPIFEQKIIDYILSKINIKKKKINVKEFKKIQEETFKNST